MTKQKTGYGEKAFFLCPHCHQRRTRLYFYQERIFCRSCAPYSPYYGLTHTTKGGHNAIAYRMRRFADKHNFEIKKFPFLYLDYDKPKGWSWNRWAFFMKQMQALENMRFQSIFLNRKYSDQTIRTIIDGTNSLISKDEAEDFKYTTWEISKYIINWDNGVDNQEHPDVWSSAPPPQKRVMEHMLNESFSI